MESLIARFFWGSTHDKKATHWINWDQARLPCEEGGLGIRKFDDMVEAFGMKLWVRFREQNSLWAKYMYKKYCHKSAPSRTPTSRRQSITWKRMARAGQKIHKHLHWVLGDGEIHFWEDIWLGDKMLSEMGMPNRKVKDFWRNGLWNVPLLAGTLEPLGVPREIVEEIAKVPIEEGGKDTLRWACTPHGKFSTSSAWEICRQRQPSSPVFKITWSDSILPSISIFIWRLLANRIPVDAKLQWRRISLASKCRCCRSPAVETREHLFLQGEVAREVWEMAAAWFPNLPRWNAAVTNLENRIRFWHRRIYHADKLHVSAIIPCLVLWFLWSERNNFVHRNTSFNAESVFNRIKVYLQQLITSGKLGKEQWKGCDNMEGFNTSGCRERPRQLIKQVRWIPPAERWIKLNKAGVWSSAEAGAGGVIRDCEGNILYGFMAKISVVSALDAELQALVFGLEAARELGQYIWVEMDSNEVVTMLNANRLGAANLRYQTTVIRNNLKHVNAKITHISAQGNMVVDYLGRQGSSGRETRVFDRESAPARVKALSRMDQLGIPNFSFGNQHRNC